MSYQKKDWQGLDRQSFLWYDKYKDLKVCFLVTHVKSAAVARWRRESGDESSHIITSQQNEVTDSQCQYFQAVSKIDIVMQ